MLLRNSKISYPQSVDDVLFWTLSGMTFSFFFFLCGIQDEVMNVSVSVNILEPYLMSLLDLYKSTSWGFFSKESHGYFAQGREEAQALKKGGSG